MKRNLVFLALLLFVLAACGGGGTSVPANTGPTTQQMGGAIQGNTLALANAVSTLAGTAGQSGFTNGTGSTARFNRPEGVTTDGTNLYVADTSSDTIRKIVISTREVTTIAGSAGQAGFANGTGSAALFNTPVGITTDGKNLYVADRLNYTIRKVVISTGAVTTLAGSPGIAGSADGTGATAIFNSPMGITTDGTNLYVADRNDGSIRKVVISTGVVTTLTSSLSQPMGITIAGTNLYVTDEGDQRIKKIDITSGAVTVVAGTGSPGSVNGIGTAASFKDPEGITTDGTNLYVSDTVNYTIRKIVISTKEVTTIAGSGLKGSTDGTGSAASFSDPFGITTD